MHAFISFKTKNFKDAISYLESKQISNIRLVEHNPNSMETMIEADVPNYLLKGGILNPAISTSLS